MLLQLDTIDADTLLSTPMRKPEFIVEKLLPQGLSILSGANKIGKSWLMLWLGICVAKGEPLWDMPTLRSEVLYLCLEDTYARIQSRLYQLVDEAPPELRFSTVCGTIGDGLEIQIGYEMRRFPSTKLIIIDTFQKVRNTSEQAKYGGIYAADYNDMSVLKKMADKYQIAILLVHHLRKLKDSDDPFNEVSGSTGITGAADTNMILKRGRGEQSAELIINGRDVEYQKLGLLFEDKKWKLTERMSEEEIRREEMPTFLPRLVKFIREREEWTGTATELLAELDDTVTPANAVTKYLARYSLEVLVPAGIEYTTRRTGQKRLITFISNDSCDGCDGESHI